MVVTWYLSYFIDPQAYSQWFEKTQSGRDLSTVTSVGLHPGVQQQLDSQRFISSHVFSSFSSPLLFSFSSQFLTSIATYSYLPHAFISFLLRFNRSTKLISEMDTLFDILDLDSADGDASSKQDNLDMSRLNIISISCLEKLPPMLDLDVSIPFSSYSLFDFPYHPPSAYSDQSTMKGLMPESIGYVLLQVFIM